MFPQIGQSYYIPVISEAPITVAAIEQIQSIRGNPFERPKKVDVMVWYDRGQKLCAQIDSLHGRVFDTEEDTLHYSFPDDLQVKTIGQLFQERPIIQSNNPKQVIFNGVRNCGRAWLKMSMVKIIRHVREHVVFDSTITDNDIKAAIRQVRRRL